MESTFKYLLISLVFLMTSLLKHSSYNIRFSKLQPKDKTKMKVFIT